MKVVDNGKIISYQKTLPYLGQKWESYGVVKLAKWPIMYGPYSPFYTQNWPLMCEVKMFKMVVRLI